MAKTTVQQTIITTSLQDEPVSRWVEGFLVDRRAKNLSPYTVKFYRVELSLFLSYCEGQVITTVAHLTPDVLRRYLLYLEDTGRNAGGVNSGYRALRAFLLWLEDELDLEGWRNPIHKVKPPKVPDEPIEPVELSTVQKLIDACKGSTFTAVRDRALFYFLLDTGARAAELCALNLADVDQVNGAVLIRQGKGRKPRNVRLGQKARRAFRQYARILAGSNPAAWLTDEGERLTYWGLNQVIKRRASLAGVGKPGLHDFRRAFAINFLRNGGDIYSLQELMGHADLQVLRRYLKQTDQDLQAAHAKASPVDNSTLRG